MHLTVFFATDRNISVDWEVLEEGEAIDNVQEWENSEWQLAVGHNFVPLIKEISAQMLGFEPKYWISGDSQLIELNTTIFKNAARMVANLFSIVNSS